MHVREYLSALGPLLRGEQADFHGRSLTAAGQQPSYRAMLDRQGRAVLAYAEAGATELVASLPGGEQDRARTREFLAALRPRLAAAAE